MRWHFTMTMLLGMVVCAVSPVVALTFQAPPGCRDPKLTCTVPGETRIISGVPVYQACWAYRVDYTCPNWRHVTNSCAKQTDCVPEGKVKVLDPWTRQLPMQCREVKVSTVCTHHVTKKICQQDFSYADGHDQFTHHDTTSFSKAMSAMGALSAMQSGLSTDPMQLFAGQSRICAKPVDLGPFTTNCCSAELSKRQSNWSINQCSGSDIQLATAKRAHRAHYVGQWCSSHFIWCLEHKKGYCTFHSSLARIVQEQGRAQINQLALHGGAHTVHRKLTWSFSGDKSGWHSAQVNGVKVAAYSYQSSTPDHLPLYLTIDYPLMVWSGQSAKLGNIQIKLQCHDTTCHGYLTQGEAQRQYAFVPSCTDKPAQWALGSGWMVQQGQCVSAGSQPAHWPHITWAKSLPNGWQFQVKHAMLITLLDGQWQRQLSDGRRIVLHSDCHDQQCSVQMDVIGRDNNQLHGTLNFSLHDHTGLIKPITVGGIQLSAPGLPNQVIWAVCTTGVSCGALPADPTTHIGEVISGWLLRGTSTMVGAYQFLTKSTAVEGHCQANRCQFSLASVGMGGYSTMLRSLLRWNAFSAPLVSGTVQPGFAKKPLTTAMHVTLKPFLYTPGSDISDGFRLQYQLPNSDTWETYPENIPLQVKQDDPVVLSADPLVQLYGSCDALSGVCRWTVSAKVKVHGMPWGSPHAPHCQGFMPSQMMLLDFSTMDLSSWVAQHQHDFGQGDQQQLTKFAEHSVKNFYDNMQQGRVESHLDPSRNDNVVMRVEPSEGQGPFEVTLLATAYWPRYLPLGQCGYPSNVPQNPSVTQLVVDWGDGATETVTSSALASIPFYGRTYGNSGQCRYRIPVFKVKHRYAAPPHHNVIEKIDVHFEVGRKMRVARFRVENYWETPSSAPLVRLG